MSRQVGDTVRIRTGLASEFAGKTATILRVTPRRGSMGRVDYRLGVNGLDRGWFFEDELEPEPDSPAVVSGRATTNPEEKTT